MKTDRPYDEPLPVEHPHHPARRAARAYARRCWWADYHDLEQEAFLATTRAMGTYDASYGTPIDAYLYRAAVLHLPPVLLRMSAPVSERPSKLKNLKGVKRFDGGESRGGLKYTLDDFLATRRDPTDPDVELDVAAWRAKVRERLSALLTDERKTELAVPVLLDRREAAEVAAAEGVPVRVIYNATQRARRRIRDDLDLWELWRAMPL